jgi:hypothetical protein
LSADTVVPGAGNPQAFNRYSYVLNRPLNMVDPTGHAQIPFSDEVSIAQIVNMDEAGDFSNVEIAGVDNPMNGTEILVDVLATRPDYNPATDPYLRDDQRVPVVMAQLQAKVNSDEGVSGKDVLNTLGVVGAAFVGTSDAGENTHLNRNSAKGHYGIYEIKIDGEVYKYGKADLGRVTQSSGDPTRLHQQLRKLRDTHSGDVKGKVINDLGVTTTAQAKQVEKATIQNHYNVNKNVPPGNQKSFKPE